MQTQSIFTPPTHASLTRDSVTIREGMNSGIPGPDRQVRESFGTKFLRDRYQVIRMAYS
jgi:hypothetical protein